ncbi:hypothetical protein ATCC90586_000951 [Pythium insidiosum]|nr:hypothetical protein ATCC90586_000951 [Pythium insidiosum]
MFKSQSAAMTPGTTIGNGTSVDHFGIPTRFGSMAAQIKAFFDSTGGLWASGALVGKPAGIFFSTGTLGGGQETTAYTAVTFLAHQGMTFVPLGYRSPLLIDMKCTAEVRGAPAHSLVRTVRASHPHWSSTSGGAGAFRDYRD